VDTGAFLFGVFGYLRESKRLFNVLDAFAEVQPGNPATALLVADSLSPPTWNAPSRRCSVSRA